MKRIKVLALVLGFCLLAAGFVLASAHTSLARESAFGQQSPQALNQPLPDLVLDEFTMSPTRPRVDEPITITIQVRNAGAGTADSWSINLYVDPPDQPPTSTTPYSKRTGLFIDLPPGWKGTLTLIGYTFTSPGCDHVLYAWTDPYDVVVESDEINNMRVIHLCVDPAVPEVPGADAYEPDDDCDVNASSIATDGTPQVRSFAPVTDTDYVKFDVTAGVAYTVTTVGTGSDAEPNLEISDSCNFALPFGTTTRLQFTAPTSGTYYLKLTNQKQNPDPNQTTYQLTVQAEAQPPTGDPPILSGISPISGTNDANTNVIITGTQFLFPTMAEVCLYRSGGCTDECIQLLDTTWRSDQKLYAIVPANLDAGSYCVQATNPGGKSGRLPDAFTIYPAQPAPDDVVPPQGYGDVSTDLHIYGFNFAKRILLALGSADLENVKVINGTHVMATLPEGLASDTYTLTARYPGDAPGQLANGFTVLAPQEDLYAQSNELWLDPLTPHAGERVNLSLRVHRRDGADLLTDLTVRFVVVDPSITDTVIDTVIPLIAIDGQVNTDYVPFTPTVEGAYTVTAIIDPDQTVPESTRANNVVTRTMDVLLAAGDTMAPHVNSLTINGGAGQAVTLTQVALSALATDLGGAGVAEVRYVEFEYNQGARLWVPVRDSHWLNYTLNRSDFDWTLTPVGGIHYIQVWSKDAAGNISHYPYQQYVNYMPPTERVGRNQVRIYRRTLAAGEMLHVTLTPLPGDADLYVWPPDWQSGRPPWVSDRFDSAVDEVTLTAPVDGVYQIEVHGYTPAEYQLDVEAGTAAALAPQSSAGVLGFKRWRDTPTGSGGPPNDSSPPALVPLARVVINSQPPVTGTVGAPHTFTATVGYPVTGTINVPITYTWQATGQSPVTETRVSVHSYAVFTWPIAGPQVITVTAENADGAVTTSHAIYVSAETLRSVSIGGPLAGFVNTEYAYVATVLPHEAGTAGWPVTYTWAAVGQSPVAHPSVGPTDTIAYIWDTPGTKAITITVSDLRGAKVSGNYYPVISDHRIYLPLVLRDSD